MLVSDQRSERSRSQSAISGQVSLRAAALGTGPRNRDHPGPGRQGCP